MAMRLPWLEDKKEEKEVEIELKPGDVVKRFDNIETKLKDIDAIKSGVESMNAFVLQAKADRVAAQQAETERQEKVRKTAEEKNAPTFEDDPDAAISNRLNPIVKQNNLLMAKQTLRDLVESGSLEYYTGDIKIETDKLIEQATAAGRAVDTEYITNAYYVAKGKRDKEIADGKIKSRFAAASGVASGVGAPETDPDKQKKTLSNEEKFYAKALGLSEDEYSNNKEVEYV